MRRSAVINRLTRMVSAVGVYPLVDRVSMTVATVRRAGNMRDGLRALKQSHIIILGEWRVRAVNIIGVETRGVLGAIWVGVLSETVARVYVGVV